MKHLIFGVALGSLLGLAAVFAVGEFADALSGLERHDDLYPSTDHP